MRPCGAEADAADGVPSPGQVFETSRVGGRLGSCSEHGTGQEAQKRLAEIHV